MEADGELHTPTLEQYRVILENNTSQSGAKRYRTEIVADDLVFLGSREKGMHGVQPPRSDKAQKPDATNLSGAGAAESDSDVPF